MNISLYPFNMYILYASIVLLVVCLLMLVMHLKPLLGALGEWKAPLDNVNRNVADMTAKTDRISKKVSKGVNTIKKAMPVILLLAAANEYYKASDENGIKEFGRSAVRVYKDKEEQKKLAKAVAKLIK